MGLNKGYIRSHKGYLYVALRGLLGNVARNSAIVKLSVKGLYQLIDKGLHRAFIESHRIPPSLYYRPVDIPCANVWCLS